MKIEGPTGKPPSPKQPEVEKVQKEKPVQGSELEEYKYANLTFKSKEAMENFKTTFLRNMAKQAWDVIKPIMDRQAKAMKKFGQEE